MEPSPESADRTTGPLQQRIRQQENLAELGVVALQGRPFPELLNETVRLTAEGMHAEFCKVLEYLPADNRLLVRAGVGWHEDIVGNTTVGADLESPSGFALRTGKPVISNHLENEQRFRTPELLVEHGIRRAMNVILQGGGSPYGCWRSTVARRENSVRTTSPSSGCRKHFVYGYRTDSSQGNNASRQKQSSGRDKYAESAGECIERRYSGGAAC